MTTDVPALENLDEVLRAVKNNPLPVKIYALGHFCVTVDGIPIDVSSRAARKPIALLKALIAFGGRNVAQQKLVQTLWVDADGGVTRKTFEITLHRLRKLFGAATLLILKNKELPLDPRSCWTDFWAFERVMSILDTAMDSTDMEPLLDCVFNLYQGPFLGGDDDLACAFQIQERLRSRLLRGTQRVAQRCEAQARIDLALRSYQRLLEAEPAVEDAYRHLVRLYHREGRHADAEICYRRCERMLRKLLDVAPSFALNASGGDVGSRPPIRPAHHHAKHPPH